MQYAQLLMPFLAASSSEMTTVHQYLYQSWIIEERYRNIGRVIQRIADVEERHFATIGKLIALLGGKPECRSTNPTSYWKGDMVDYSRDIRTILTQNAKSEAFAANAYMEHSKMIRDPYISKMLVRLSLDEKLHHKIFSDFLAQL